MSRRALAFLVFALLVSAGCVRLGIWQLHRLRDRRALNAVLAARLTAPPRPVRDVLADSAPQYRRAVADGTYDFANEFVLAARTRQGSPGVNVVTPLRLAGTDTAVLVNRGWIYAPDAMTADLARWREAPEASPSGYLLAIGRDARGAVTAASNTRVLRHLHLDSLSARLPYPVAPYLLVETDSVTGRALSAAPAADSVPARLEEPILDEGPHLGYAIQWFAFALIGIVGAGVGIRADRRGGWRRTVGPARRPFRR